MAYGSEMRDSIYNWDWDTSVLGAGCWIWLLLESVAIAIAIAFAVAVISHVAKIYGFHLLVSHVEANASSSRSSGRGSSDGSNNKIEFCPDCARCSRYD